MTVYQQFADIPDDIAGALEQGASTHLFSSRDWFDNYVDTVVAADEQVTLLAAGGAASPIVLPLCQAGADGLASPRTVSSLANFYTTHFRLLGDGTGNVAAGAIDEIAAEITALRPRPDRLDISPVDASAEWLPDLSAALASRGWMTQQYHCFKNLYLENTYADFATYLKSRSSRIRKTAANRMRKFDRDEGNSFRILTTPEELEDGFKVFQELYESRWQKSEPYPEFLPGLARLSAEKGWLRLGLGFVGEQPAAAQFWIVRNGVAYIFKVAYDEQFTNLSVGAVALFKMFEYVMDNDQVTLIDFLTGDEAYKRDWMDQSRDMVGLAAFNRRTAKGLITGICNIGGSATKRMLRGNRPGA